MQISFLELEQIRSSNSIYKDLCYFEFFSKKKIIFETILLCVSPNPIFISYKVYFYQYELNVNYFYHINDFLMA